MIELREVSRAFGDFQLSSLSLRLGKGEYWTLLGPSGSGKSMLLHTIAGIYRPNSGTILSEGRDATHLAPEERNVGLVFQQSALFPHMSVRSNIEYGPRVRSVDREERERRVLDLVASLDLASILDRPVATLSGGEAQKVAIARALATRPELLLLDEPLGPIDTHARLELQGVLKRVHDEHGLTTLHVTHDREEARALGDCCAVMIAGRVVQAGPIESVFANPATAGVAQFLGL